MLAGDAGPAAGNLGRCGDQRRPARRCRIDDGVELLRCEDAFDDRAHHRQGVIAHRGVAVVVQRAAPGFALHHAPAPRVRTGAVGTQGR